MLATTSVGTITAAFSPVSGDGVVSSSTTAGALVRHNGTAFGPQRVILIDMYTNRAVRETFSAADGSWEIANLTTERPFTARVLDPTGQLNGAVLDWIQAQVP